jgi:hypothetical protein
MSDRILLSRRTLLATLGASAASPLVMRGRAQANLASPKRFIVIHVPEGMWAGAPRPQPGATTLGPILSPLDKHMSRVCVLDNLAIPSSPNGPGGDGHHRQVPHMLTGIEMFNQSTAGGPSVDQVIAKAISSGRPFRSLQFAVRIIYGDTNARCIWDENRVSLPAMQDPFAAFSRVFKGEVTGAAPPPDFRKSILDHARGELKSIAPKLSATDRHRLESYEASIRSIENRLATVAPPTCGKPTLGDAFDVRAEPNYPRTGRLQTDIMIAAMQCDLTRVASFQWGNSNDQCTYSFLGINTKGHDLSHNSGSGANKVKVYNWYAQQMAYLMDQLAARPEGNGTMLDNTAILWVSEFGDSNSHANRNLMWVLMGNVGGQLKTGKVLPCNNRSVNDVHTALCNAYGIPMAKFGGAAYCQGPLSGLI